MDNPPAQLDGADVLCWARSRLGGFYLLAGSDPLVMVVGMAVARYASGGPIYLFKCDADWEVVQDWDCGSIEEARELAAEHSKGETLNWHPADYIGGAENLFSKGASMSVREAAEELVARAAAAGRRGRVLTSDEANMLTDEVAGYPGWLAELLAQVPLCGLELGWSEPELDEPQWLEWADGNAAKSESVEFYPGLAILPAGYVNVAADAGGGSDPFFISVHEGPDPALYQIYHDVGSEAEDILRDGRKLVAPSLSEFFKSALIRPKG